MADNTELRRKILEFLMPEWARQDNRQLVAVDLVHAPGGGFRDDPIRKWVRADEPDFFAEFVNVEKLVSLIIEIAETEVDAKPPGKHRFKIVTHQHFGERPYMSFSLAPSYHGGEDTALVFSNGGGSGGSRGGAEVAAAQILAGNNAQLMRINTQMFDGTIRVLAVQSQNMHEQIITLTTENAMLRRELEDARSNKMDREFQIAMAAEKNNRTNAAFKKILQIGTVAVSKFAGGNDAAQFGEGNPLTILCGEFYQSLRQEQLGVLMQMLDMAQKIMFMEIVNLVQPPENKEPEPGPGSRQPPPGGVNGSRS